MAKKYIEVSDFKFDLSGLAYMGTWDIYKTAEYFMKQVQALPAADVVEVKRGKWIPVTYRYETNDKEFPNTKIVWMDATEPDDIEGMKCSECGTIYDFTEARNWCSECGAKMTEEE